MRDLHARETGWACAESAAWPCHRSLPWAKQRWRDVQHGAERKYANGRKTVDGHIPPSAWDATGHLRHDAPLTPRRPCALSLT